MTDVSELVGLLTPQPTRVEEHEAELERMALELFESSSSSIEFPDVYTAFVCDYQAVFFGEASSPIGGSNRWSHALPTSMFVFRADTSQPLRRPGRTVAGNVSDLGDAIEQLLGSGYAAARRSLVPFAGDSHGWFCLDFLFDDGVPVVFIDPEQDWSTRPAAGFRFVAPGFGEFIEGLEYPDEFGDYPTPRGAPRSASSVESSWNLHRERELLRP